MEWLDAMRGFTMLLVVAFHVAQHSYGITPRLTASFPLLLLLRMPLFFFVSGFLAYKADMVWTTGRYGMSMWKKLKIQLIPTIVFLCATIALKAKEFGTGMLDALSSPTKAGFWFTWALLIMFVIYYTCEFLSAKSRSIIPWLKRHTSVPIVLLLLVSLCIYETAYLPKDFKYPTSDFMKYSSLIEVIYFFHFFLFGNLLRRHWSGTERLMDSRWFFPVLAVITFLCCGDYLKWHTLKTVWANLPRTVGMYGLLLLVMMSFRHYGETFSQKTRVGRTLQYIGTRTLDIYLLHYLFLPKLPEIGKWFNSIAPNFVLEQLATLIPALIIVAFCCLVSNVLRVSPFLRKHLFGRK